MRILIVEDDQGVRESLARALQYEGYAVEVAADGFEALKSIRADDHDAIVLDKYIRRSRRIAEVSFDGGTQAVSFGELLDQILEVAVFRTALPELR